MNIVSVNYSTFLFRPILEQAVPETDINAYLDERLQSNIDFVLNSIMIKK